MLTVTEDKCTMFGGGLDSDMDNLSMGGQIPRRSKRNGGRKAESNINYHTGTVCDARDFQNDWFRAEILAIAPNKRKKYYVHFEGFSDRYNEWVAKKDLAPLGTKSKAKDASYSSASTAPSIDCMIHPDQKKKMLDWIASSPNCEIGRCALLCTRARVCVCIHVHV